MECAFEEGVDVIEGCAKDCIDLGSMWQWCVWKSGSASDALSELAERGVACWDGSEEDAFENWAWLWRRWLWHKGSGRGTAQLRNGCMRKCGCDVDLEAVSEIDGGGW